MVDRLQGKKVVGVKQATKALKAGLGMTLYIAENADAKVIQPLKELAHEKNVEVVLIDTMLHLGKLSGIEVGSAATLILQD
ncbi:MAG: ribosomal L7Ae/L30e/S12e/Gadd45 family protein [Clostridiaceae bacterium]